MEPIKEALMSEEQLEKHLEDKKSIPLSQTFGFGAGTFLTVGAIDLLAHLGPTGLVVGGIAAYVAAQHGPELIEQVRAMFPSPDPDTRILDHSIGYCYLSQFRSHFEP
jgi:hypothetical protein